MSLTNINGFEIDIFNQYGLEAKAKYSTCPICSENRKKKTEKCLSLHWDSGIGQCNHCGERVQLHTYKKRKDIEQIKTYTKPIWKNNTELSAQMVKWFEGRGISQNTLKFMQVSEGMEWMPQTRKEENTIQFNYFKDNELVNVKFRDARKNFKLSKNCELTFYNIDAIRTTDDVLILEGEIDVLSFIEVGYMNVVSVPNGSTIKGVNLEYLDNCIHYFDNKKVIYIGLDCDEAGFNVSKELVRRLGAERCRMIDYSVYKKIKEVGKETESCKDGNEVLINHGKPLLLELIKDAKEVPIEGISSVMDWKEQFDEYVTNGMKKGFTCNIQSFDNVFSTYLKQFIVVSGSPSSGKSDFVDMMCLGYNRTYEWKVAFASPENKPNVIHAGKLISKIAGHWVDNGIYTKQVWYQQACEYVHDYFKFIDLDGSYDLVSVLEKAKEMIIRFGIKVLVIDPYNKVRLKGSLNKNVNEYTNDYLCLVDEFARKYDILILLVAHPTKPIVEKGVKRKPDFYAIKGGGEFYDMSPHGIWIARNYENKTTEVTVLKCKFNHLGINGATVNLRWNFRSGRYIDFENNNENFNECGCEMLDNQNWITDTNTFMQEREFVNNSNQLEPNNNFDNENPF